VALPPDHVIMTGRARICLGVLLVLVSACSPGGDPDAVGELPVVSAEEMDALLDQATRPVVLNVWASWCIPCRSEAPLLREAHSRFGDRVRFVGLDIQDSQANARAFLDEFGLTDFEHYFDATGAVSNSLGGRGVPVTFFYRPGGQLFDTHFGVIDERTLALNIDELLAG
jgi:thiol-disulfide isomerase/thioredoxin